MKILIVDDEVIIRNGLCTVIDWEALGMTLLPPAESAEEALERLADEQPDIVLTDIRMPGMDGIELAKEIKSLRPDTEIVILTGYDDFGYARQALREGVTDYLLKTSGPEEIMMAAMKAKQNLLAKWETMKQEAVQGAALRNQGLEELLAAGGKKHPAGGGADAARKWLEEAGVAKAGPDGGLLPMRVLLVGASGWDDDRFAGLMLGAAESRLLELLPCVTLRKHDRIVAVLRAGEGWSDTSRLATAVSRVREALKCDIFAAAGEPAPSFTALGRSYEEAEQAFAYRPMLGDRGLIEAKEVLSRKGGRTVCSAKEENELSSLLMNSDATQLRNWTSGIVGEQLADPQATPATLQAYLQSIVIAAHRWLDRARDKGAEASASAPVIALQPGVRLEDELFKLLLSVLNAFHDRVSAGRYAYIHRAIAYIRLHLDRHLTLQQVAGFVHVNPNHFSEMFKKETGQSYTEFVTRERMQRAANILLTTRMKISEVAGEAGYEDIKYFSQQFKKVMGCTPSEYRQMSV
ncbi:response regulator [Cohnella sp. JJ-181]|uniref:response regulator n=1 Tax=Cohnella rhizoplanae TaxID=2974897 RepID=UPI0022FF5557|nr:response regulator [Cohnella sp. JJ-181]CAI6083039.1 Protein-glutamate methylesterase/protein-glutamine glutaminase [Cohnella sp. JJ-181]